VESHDELRRKLDMHNKRLGAFLCAVFLPAILAMIALITMD
jgi:hypothetical protein